MATIRSSFDLPGLPPWSRRPVRWAGAALLLYVVVEVLFGRSRTTSVLGVPFPTGISLGILVNGALIGTLYALIAFGLILIYRANRLISFAQAGLGSVPAVAALLLVTNRGVPYGVAVVLMLIGSALAGFLVEVVIMRRFRDSPRLIATVATIGIAQLLALVEVYLPQWIGGRALPPTSFPTPFDRFKVTIGGVIFNGNYVAIIVVASAVVAALAAFLRFTRVGIAVRASAENADRASLLGVPVKRLSTYVWVIAAMCSGIAVFLQGPVIGLPLGGTISPIILLYGLAAAVVARMESLPTAFGAGMAIGVIEQASFAGTSKPDLSAALMLPIILAALLAQRQHLSRAFDTGISTFRALQEFRPIPVQLRDLPEVVRTRRAGLAVVGALFLTAPFLLGAARANFASLVLIFAMVGISVVILSGWAGQISLGQFAFTGVGAAVAGGLAANHHQDFFVTIGAAAVCGAVVAILIGLPALRVQGLFLAVVTLAFAATVQYVVLSHDYFGWLLPKRGAFVTRPVFYGRLDATSDRAFYYVILAFLLLAYLSAKSLRASRSGRVFIAMRDNVRAAQSYGASSAGSRLAAFAIAGAIAAVAGALLAYQQQAVDQDSYGVLVSLDVFVFTVVGGLTSLPGGVLGAIYYEGLQYIGPGLGLSQLAVLGTGVGVLLLLLVLPGGLAQGAFRLRDAGLRRLADRKGIHVPALVADRSRWKPTANPRTTCCSRRRCTGPRRSRRPGRKSRRPAPTGRGPGPSFDAPSATSGYRSQRPATTSTFRT